MSPVRSYVRGHSICRLMGSLQTNLINILHNENTLQRAPEASERFIPIVTNYYASEARSYTTVGIGGFSSFCLHLSARTDLRRIFAYTQNRKEHHSLFTVQGGSINAPFLASNRSYLQLKRYN